MRTRTHIFIPSSFQIEKIKHYSYSINVKNFHKTKTEHLLCQIHLSSLFSLNYCYLSFEQLINFIKENNNSY